MRYTFILVLLILSGCESAEERRDKIVSDQVLCSLDGKAYVTRHLLSTAPISGFALDRSKKDDEKCESILINR